jgi:hypothetical protein
MTTMETLFRSDRARSFLLNGAIAVIFVAAWISDRWPVVAIPAVAVAAAVVALEAAWLFVSAKRAKQPKTRNDEDGSGPLYVGAKLGDVTLLDAAERAAKLAAAGGPTPFPTIQLRNLERRLYDSWLSEWADAGLRHADIRKWRLQSLGERAFCVNAGAFQIQHFYGHTNIVVVNGKHVTIEERGRNKLVNGAADARDDVELRMHSSR